MVGSKRCPRCGEVKAFADFYADRFRSDGMTSWCKSCRRARQCEYAAANRSREAARVRAWRAAGGRVNRSEASKERGREYHRNRGRQHAK